MERQAGADRQHRQVLVKRPASCLALLSLVAGLYWFEGLGLGRRFLQGHWLVRQRFLTGAIRQMFLLSFEQPG